MDEPAAWKTAPRGHCDALGSLYCTGGTAGTTLVGDFVSWKSSVVAGWLPYALGLDDTAVPPSR